MTKAGRPIHILIQKPDGEVGNTALTPSANPVEIEEEGKENLFVPIKLQSGYIEVITDSISLAKRIIPTRGGTRSVAIYETATPTSYTDALWRGYVQPKLLNFTLWRGNQKLKIPIECKLSALKYKPISLPSTMLTNIGTLLYRNLGYFDYAYFQGGIVMERPGNTADQARAWLRKKVYTSLFTNDMTRYDLIEQLCTFFGWTCRQFSESVYFIANRNIDAPSITIRRILVDDLKSASYASVETLWQEVQLTGSMLCSANNKAKFAEGLSVAKASCELTAFNTVHDVDFVQIGLAIDNGSINPVNNGEDDEWSQGGHQYYREWNNYFTAFGQQTAVTIGDFTVKGYNVQPVLEKNDSTDVNEWNTEMVVWYTSDYTSDTYWVESQEPTSPPYQQTDINFANRYYGYLEFESANAIAFVTNGVLVIHVGLSERTGSRPKACFYVKMGNLWYNPTNGQWQSTQPSTYMELTPDNMDGYSINIPQAMTGTLLIKFVTDTTKILHREYLFLGYSITSVSVDFTAEQQETYNSQISSVEHEARNSTGYKREMSFDSMICLRGSMDARSKNFLLENDETETTGLYDTPYSDAQPFSPLQRLCDQAIEEGAMTGVMYEINARWRGGLIHNITPATMIYITPLEEWAYPVSCIYNLRDDEVRLRLMKRIYLEGNQ